MFVSQRNNLWHAIVSFAVVVDLFLTSSAHSTRTPNPTSLLFPSHGDDHCDAPRDGATFGQLAESNLPTGYEPNDLAEMNITEVTPIFFHRPRHRFVILLKASRLPPPESDFDEEQIRNMLFTTVLTREKSKCRPITSLSRLQRKLCVKFISFPRECMQ